MSNTHSTSETGHYKNLAAFKMLHAYVATLPKYNPARASLQAGNMAQQFQLADGVMNNLSAAEVKESKTGKDRAKAFQELPALSTRIVNELESVSPTSSVLPMAHHILSKMQGIRIGSTDNATPAAAATAGAAAGTEGSNHSVSQQSFDALLDQFDQLIDALEAEPTYATNQADLAIPTLHNHLDAITSLHDQANLATKEAASFRSARQQALYGTVSGLVPTALAAKKAVLSAYGASSAEYKQARSIHFRTIE